MNDVVKKYQIGPDCFLKSWTFVGWLFDIFQNGSDFYQGPSAPNWKSYFELSQSYILFIIIQTISLKLMALSKKVSHETSLLVKLLKF